MPPQHLDLIVFSQYNLQLNVAHLRDADFLCNLFRWEIWGPWLITSFLHLLNLIFLPFYYKTYIGAYIDLFTSTAIKPVKSQIYPHYFNSTLIFLTYIYILLGSVFYTMTRFILLNQKSNQAIALKTYQ